MNHEHMLLNVIQAAFLMVQLVHIQVGSAVSEVDFHCFLGAHFNSYRTIRLPFKAIKFNHAILWIARYECM